MKGQVKTWEGDAYDQSALETSATAGCCTMRASLHQTCTHLQLQGCEHLSSCVESVPQEAFHTAVAACSEKKLALPDQSWASTQAPQKTLGISRSLGKDIRHGYPARTWCKLRSPGKHTGQGRWATQEGRLRMFGESRGGRAHLRAATCVVGTAMTRREHAEWMSRSTLRVLASTITCAPHSLTTGFSWSSFNRRAHSQCPPSNPAFVLNKHQARPWDAS